MEREVLISDASVIIKWFTDEEGRKEALILRERFRKGEIEIVVPDLALYEISNALRYNSNFSEEDVGKAVSSLFDIRLSVVSLSSHVLKESIKIAFDKNTSVYDAFYLALANELKVNFITSDRKFYDKVKDFKFIKLL